MYCNSHFSPAQMGLLDYAMIALWIEEQLWSWKGISLQITHTPISSQHILDSQPKTSSHALMAQLSAHCWTTCTGQLSHTFKAKCLTTSCRLQMQAKSKAERSNAARDWCGTLTVFILSDCLKKTQHRWWCSNVEVHMAHHIGGAQLAAGERCEWCGLRLLSSSVHSLPAWPPLLAAVASRTSLTVGRVFFSKSLYLPAGSRARW